MHSWKFLLQVCFRFTLVCFVVPEERRQMDGFQYYYYCFGANRIIRRRRVKLIKHTPGMHASWMQYHLPSCLHLYVHWGTESHRSRRMMACLQERDDREATAVLHHKTALNPSQIYGQAKSQVGEISASRVSAVKRYSGGPLNAVTLRQL